MGGTQRIVIPYDERPQFSRYHDRTERWAAIVAHRRAGKTVACINDLIKAALTLPLPNPRFAYIAPYFSQAKDVAWTYLKHYAMAVPGVEANESELRVDFPNGGRVRLYGAENYDRLRGLALDGAVLDEPADMDPRVFPEVIRPALSDRRGWATWIGTPKGRNHFHAIVGQARTEPGWLHLELKASETRILPEDELTDARKAMTPEQYAQEYECDFNAALVGAYYAKDVVAAEADGRVGSVPLDRAADVYAAWDLGISDSTAIWVGQLVGREIHFIDYIESAGLDLGRYVDELKAKPYTITEHWLPHDVEQRELTTGKTRLEFMKGRGLRCKVIPRHAPQDRINAARVAFNRMWFDAKRCERGLEVLRMYQEKRDEKRNISLGPLHDWASHGADAFGYFVMGLNDRPDVLWPTAPRLKGIV